MYVGTVWKGRGLRSFRSVFPNLILFTAHFSNIFFFSVFISAAAEDFFKVIFLQGGKPTPTFSRSVFFFWFHGIAGSISASYTLHHCTSHIFRLLWWKQKDLQNSDIICFSRMFVFLNKVNTFAIGISTLFKDYWKKIYTY